MVHKFSSELMFSHTPDPLRLIFTNATSRLKMDSCHVIQFSAPPVLSPATFKPWKTEMGYPRSNVATFQ
jgi:hypothetical protein